MTKKILLISTIFVLLFLGFGYFFDTHVSYEKLISKDKVPEAVLEKLYETDLERGTYVFTNNFIDNYAYLVICGGEQFKHGYDVNIKRIHFKDDWERKIEVKIAELNTDSSLNYCKDKDSPFVIFRIKDVPKYYEKFMMFSVSLSTDNNTDISVNNWWGNDKRNMQEKFFSYKIIDNRAEIADVVWEKLMTYNFSKVPSICVFSPSRAVYSYEIEDLYLVISPGSVEKSNYSIEIENILFGRTGNSKNIQFTVSYREYFNKANTGFFNDLGYPFEVVKISSDAFKEKKQRVKDLIMDITIDLNRGYLVKNTTSYYDVVTHYILPFESTLE